MKIHDFSLVLSLEINRCDLMEGLQKLRGSQEQVASLIAKTADWNPWPAPKLAATAPSPA